MNRIKKEYIYFKQWFYYSIRMKYFCIPMWKLQIMVWRQRLEFKTIQFKRDVHGIKPRYWEDHIKLQFITSKKVISEEEYETEILPIIRRSYINKVIICFMNENGVMSGRLMYV